MNNDDKTLNESTQKILCNLVNQAVEDSSSTLANFFTDEDMQVMIGKAVTMEDALQKVESVEHPGIRIMKLEDEEAYFGMCPECGSEGMHRHIGKGNWFYCEDHKLAWCAGFGLISRHSCETETPEEELAFFKDGGYSIPDHMVITQYELPECKAVMLEELGELDVAHTYEIHLKGENVTHEVVYGLHTVPCDVQVRFGLDRRLNAKEQLKHLKKIVKALKKESKKEMAMWDGDTPF